MTMHGCSVHIFILFSYVLPALVRVAPCMWSAFRRDQVGITIDSIHKGLWSGRRERALLKAHYYTSLLYLMGCLGARAMARSSLDGLPDLIDRHQGLIETDGMLIMLSTKAFLPMGNCTKVVRT